MNYCCTTPDPGGIGNITNEPAFVDLAGGDLHLRSLSPCINVGGNKYVAGGNDLDGNPRIVGGTVDIGAYEFQSAIPLSAVIQADATNAIVGYPLYFTGLIFGGLAISNVWDFGDGTVVTNQLTVSHSWALAGDYPVTFIAFNDSNPGGVSTTVTVYVVTQSMLYVSLASTNPIAPYLSWDTAATNIQDAVDVAIDGETVLVSNGVYQTGGRVAYGSQSNRVAVTKPLTVQSVNGPAVTIIQGNPVIGDTAVRCAYLTNDATLIGFTLTQGATTPNDSQAGGGVFCESASAIVSNCVITANAAVGGGGGAYGGTLNNCVLCSNTVAYYDYYGSGGGACTCTLNNCLLYANSANFGGGGSDSSTLNNCTIVNNSSGFLSAGAYNVTLNNCIVYYNNGDNYGDSTLNDCCTTPLPDVGADNISNEPLFVNLGGGDFHLQSHSPCINLGNNTFVSGTSDLDGNARIVGSSVDIGVYEFQTALPLTVAIGADNTNMVAGHLLNFSGLVFDGRAATVAWDFGDGTMVSNQLSVSHGWAAVGDYPVVFTAFNDSNTGGVSATVTVHVVMQSIHYVSLGRTNPVSPYLSWDTAATNIQDAVDASTVVGALVLVSNGVYQTGGRVIYGSLTNRLAVTKPLTVQSVNGAAVTVIQGFQVPGTIEGDSAVRCVYMTNNSTLIGFTLTSGAVRGDGDANLERSGGGIWSESTNAAVINCIMSGNYAYDGNTGTGSGGGAYSCSLSNCILVNNSGFSGGGAADCVLNNCTLTGNYGEYGGAAFECSLLSCTLTNNTGGFGGATYSGTLINCICVNNTATQVGGGACFDNLDNCILSGNGAEEGGGGIWAGGVNNSIIVNNSPDGSDYAILNNCIEYYNQGEDYSGSYNYCCIDQLPSDGLNNFTNIPLFLNLAAGDLHLQPQSPCINAGNNGYIMLTNDLDGNPRIVGGTVDIGAYEYQTPSSVISYAWLQQYGLPTDGSVDFADLDGTGMNNWQKWIAGLNPTNALSVLRMASATMTNNPPGLVVTWQSVSNITYFLQSSSNLGAQPAFSTIQSNIIGQAGTTSYTDTTATNCGPYFYRVGVQ